MPASWLLSRVSTGSNIMVLVPKMQAMSGCYTVCATYGASSETMGMHVGGPVDDFGRSLSDRCGGLTFATSYEQVDDMRATWTM